MGTAKIRMTPAILHVLLALAEGDRHGYAILSRVEQRAHPSLSLGPSSLYYTLGRLEDRGLIEETEPPDDAAEEARAEMRRYWRLTARGRQRLEQELGVLSEIVEQGRALDLGSRS